MAAIRHRLFFALRPPPRQRNLIGWQRDALAGDTPVANDRLHLTLGVTPDFASPPGAAARTLIEIGRSIQADPPRIRLDRLAASNRSVALRPSRNIPPLTDLGRDIANRLRRTGLLRERWDFHPHVTLLYRDGPPYQHAIEPIWWDAGEFVLIHSLVGATQHVELARWPLTSRQLPLAL
ncbi:2'-5' RNA ligase family protein [Sphingomonas sp.]|uniref:2'-5' RNA ligase family protein n=1 Tax=Sphingomonas sp. TaxID=28214 RepID=UPI001EB7DF28|nr:2'-5' RNA ligase family protein [Sphingomonas sp.]MBX3594902.1 2'-5' RNA ligase family protein [Sphingomonas sp.]